jgi:TolA-binding protein
LEKEVIGLSARKLTKKDIKEDTFITATLRGWEYFREHQNYFFIGLIVIIVVIAAVSWKVHNSSEASMAANTQLSEALQIFRGGNIAEAETAFKAVSDRYGSSREGVYAMYLAGTCALMDGRNPAAIESFDAYLRKSGTYPFFRDAALDGKATALENMQRYREAADVYLELIDNIKTNDFNKPAYLRKAADDLKRSNQTAKAIEVLEQLLEKSSGFDKRDIEIEIAMLRG